MKENKEISRYTIPLSIGVHLIAKAPVAGWCNTRLGKKIGFQDAARLQELFIQDHLDLLNKHHLKHHIWLGLPDNTQKAPAFIKRGTPITLLNELSLLEVLQISSEAGKNQFQWNASIFLGTDSLHALEVNLSPALSALKDNKLVLGPTEDGGVYLIASPHSIHLPFQDIPWETSGVFSAFEKIISNNRIKHKILSKSRDLDNVEDLHWLKAKVLKNSRSNFKSYEFLKKLKI